MKDEVKKYLAANRKAERELIELKKALEKAKAMVNPDQKLVAMIEAEIRQRST